jgi:hypothetical protein
MQIIIEPESSYLFRPSNLRELMDIWEETIAEWPKDRTSTHQTRLYKMLDLLEALQRAERGASR